MICPLLDAGDNASGATGAPIECKRERCAWWNGTELMCAVSLLATLLRPEAPPRVVVQRGLKVEDQDDTLFITRED